MIGISRRKPPGRRLLLNAAHEAVSGRLHSVVMQQSTMGERIVNLDDDIAKVPILNDLPQKHPQRI